MRPWLFIFITTLAWSLPLLADDATTVEEIVVPGRRHDPCTVDGMEFPYLNSPDPSMIVAPTPTCSPIHGCNPNFYIGYNGSTDFAQSSNSANVDVQIHGQLASCVAPCGAHGLEMYTGPTWGKTISVPYTSIRDAERKKVDLSCPPSTCTGYVLYPNREQGPAFLRVMKDSAGHQVTDLVVNTEYKSKFTSDNSAEPSLRQCETPVAARSQPRSHGMFRNLIHRDNSQRGSASQ